MGIVAELVQQVRAHQPRQLGNSELAKAAVLVAITDEADPKVILTLRSSELPTHKGEVAFAGGKTENDETAIETALREAQEEIGLDPQHVEVVGELGQVVSRYGFLVTPVLALVPPGLDYTVDPRELDSIFQVPLRFFTQGQPDQIDQFGQFRGPRWYFEGYTIWGLTAMMLAEMFNEFCQTDFELSMGHLDDLLDPSVAIHKLKR